MFVRLYVHMDLPRAGSAQSLYCSGVQYEASPRKNLNEKLEKKNSIN